MSDKFDRAGRGGPWWGDARYARAAYRDAIDPSIRYIALGIRLVEVVGDPAPASDAAPAPYAAKPDPVYRGGSWSFDSQNARIARRNFDGPSFRRSRLGIRLVEVIDE